MKTAAAAAAVWVSISGVVLNGTWLNNFHCANIDLSKIIEVKLPMGFSFGEDSKICGI